MIYFDPATQRYEQHTLKAIYLSYGQQEQQYTSDKDYWHRMEQRWEHVDNLSFSDVTPTQEQTDRLAEINQHPLLSDLYGYEASLYVEHGIIPEDNEAPFLGTTV